MTVGGGSPSGCQNVPVAVRVTQISDTHLSAKRSWSVPNYEAVLRHLNAELPDFVVNTGDIILDDPDDLDDAAFALALHQRITVPWFALPGNHDVGDNGISPWQDQPPTEARLQRFVDIWGADRFSVDADGWRLVGCNNLLVGTGLPAEAEQEEWLRDQLAGAERVALFLHKPICLTAPDADDGPGGPLELPERLRFWSLLQGTSVRLIASGHLHRYKAGELPGGIATVWAPTAAFLGRDWHDGAVRDAGIIEYVLDGDRVSHRLVVPAGMQNFMVSEVMDTYGSLRFAPELPWER
jgi:3',5'-cyclic AMP phosphodiesterase CpdA